MPCDYSKYPPDWKQIRQRILIRENHKCKFCGAENYKPHPQTGSKVVLTIAHLDHDETNWEVKDERLAALCQRCHIRYDIPEKRIRRKEKKMLEMFKNEPVRVLTWKEPFATLMLAGKIETRTWNTNYRGLVLIHAAQKAYTEMQMIGISGERQTQNALVTLNGMGVRENPGHIIEIGRLVDCRKMEKADEDACFVMFNESLYCHIYEDVQPIIPIPHKGKQGWCTAKPELLEQIKLKRN